MTKLQLLLRSRKFWAALTGMVMVVLKGFFPDLPLDEEQITALVVVLAGYILGTALEDAGRTSPPGPLS